MDLMGIEWCEKHSDKILIWLAEEAATRSVFGWSMNEIWGFDTLAKATVAKAIANAKQQRIKLLPKINPNRIVPRPTDTPTPIPAEFTTEPTRHMIYHIWPTKRSDAWKWNVTELRKRIELFNGLRIVGIAEASDCDSVDDVKAAFAGVRIDHWVIVPNDEKLGEGATFRKMMELLPRGINDITWYGHAKGTKYPQGQAGIVPRWTSLMYRSTLDHYSEVYKSLEQFPITGSLKRYGEFNKPNTWRWHYSGTFYWFRNKETFSRPEWTRLVPFYGCVECWPSCVYRATEGGVLLGNDVGLLYLEPEVVKLEEQLKEWPPDNRPSSNGVSDRRFFEEEYRRQIEAGHWQELIAIHKAGAASLKNIGVKTVIEIGSGLGPFLVGAKEIGLDAAGMGCSPFERDFAISQGIAPELYTMASVTDFKLKPVDAVYCIEVFEHIPDKELKPLLQQIGEKCKWFYFSSTPHSAEDDQQWGHINLKSKEGWIEMFAEYGLQFVREDYSVVPWGMLFTSSMLN
jgi:hypothetical protein